MLSLKVIRSLGLALAAALSGCAPGAGHESVGVAQSSLFSNGNFETGAPGAAPPSWTVQSFLNNGITLQTPQTRAGLNLQPGGKALTTIINGYEMLGVRWKNASALARQEMSDFQIRLNNLIAT